jgi:FAD-linked oxidoreductase
VSPIWTNWAGDQRCAPETIEAPGSEDELVAAVARAAEDGVPIRAVGAGHSFSDVACTDGRMVRLDRMTRVIGADPSSGLVEVEAGIELGALGERLAEHGLGMENLGDIDKQTLAGAVSTATHGTGATLRNISAQVAAARLVTASGEVVRCSDEDDPELFRAARVGLGALGVISTVTLRCLPAYVLRRLDRPEPLEETMDRIDEIVDSRRRYEFWVFPYTRTALSRTTAETDEAPRPDEAARIRRREAILENRVLDVICRFGRLVPVAAPLLDRLFARAATGSELIDASHRVYANQRDIRFTEMEYALPREAGVEALRRIMDLVERRRLPVTFPIEVRFVAADDAFLSPASGRDTCYLAIHVYRGTDHESYFRAAEAVFADYGGRPHWGKRHYQTAATLAPLYPDWDRFQAVRARVDPEGLFRSEHTDRVLGPVGAGPAYPAPSPAAGVTST